MVCTTMELVGIRSFTLATSNNKLSRLRRFKNSIPQGSFLAPPYFNIHISDFSTTISRKYAYAVWFFHQELPGHLLHREQGCSAGVTRSQEVFGWSWSKISNNTRSQCRSWIFCSTLTPEVQLNHFLHHTPKLEIPVEMVQFLSNFYWNREFLLCTTISIDC